MDPIAALVAARQAELHATAAAARSARRYAVPRPVPRTRRLYARMWWAARPRADGWIPGLFEPVIRSS